MKAPGLDMHPMGAVGATGTTMDPLIHMHRNHTLHAAMRSLAYELPVHDPMRAFPAARGTVEALVEPIGYAQWHAVVRVHADAFAVARNGCTVVVPANAEMLVPLTHDAHRAVHVGDTWMSHAMGVASSMNEPWQSIYDSIAEGLRKGFDSVWETKHA